MTARVVILSTADFHSPAWTNKQHLAREMARHVDVSYIESFGLRQPTLRAADLRRIMMRLRSANRKKPTSRTETYGVNVVHPVVIPFHRFAFVRWVNKLLVKRLSVGGPDSVLWTFSPFTYGLENQFGHTVYHSVDLLHTQPGVPAQACLSAECSLLKKADRVIASSTGVRDHLRALGRDDVLLWENVADTGLYSTPNEKRTSRAVFAGNLTPVKVDFGLLRRLASAGVAITLAGPTSIDGTSARDELNELLAEPGIEYVGNLPPQQLAPVLASSAVGLIPYVLNSYTAGVFPMKVYEYLAAGLQVVSTELPSLTRLQSEDVVLAAGKEFLPVVEEAVVKWSETAASRRRTLAEGHSWQARGAQALALLNELGVES